MTTVCLLPQDLDDVDEVYLVFHWARHARMYAGVAVCYRDPSLPPHRPRRARDENR